MTLPRPAILVILGLALLLGTWFMGALTYRWYGDTVVQVSGRSDPKLRALYEDRISELRARIDKLSTRQIVNQDSMEDRVSALVARQAELEARQLSVSELGARAEKMALSAQASASPPFTGSLGAGKTAARSRMDDKPLPYQSTLPNAGTALPTEAAPLKPQPIAESESKPLESLPEASIKPGQSLEPLINQIEKRTQILQKTQIQTLDSLSQIAQDRVQAGRKLVAALGLDPARFGKNTLSLPTLRRLAPLDEFRLRDVNTADTDAMGGPLLPPVPDKSGMEGFFNTMHQVETLVESAERVHEIREALPIGRPMPETYELTSGFGTRLDPFTRSLAMHAGIDFRAPIGTPIRAVAPGTVLEAGPNGGYGRMVEIDHGYGISTRYAHLSSIAVQEGQKIARGAVLGAVGSSGRSTGPHLHYEIRIDDDAADPQRFIRVRAPLTNGD